MATIVLGVYFTFSTFLTHEQSNTLAFVALVVVQWANAFTSRGIYESCFKRLKVKNSLFLLAFCAAILLQILATFGPLSVFVSVVPVPLACLLPTILVSFFVSVLIVELHKKSLARRRSKKVVKNTTKK